VHIIRFVLLLHTLSAKPESVSDHTPGSLLSYTLLGDLLMMIGEVGHHYSSWLRRPTLLAQTAAWVRSQAPSFVRMCST
jgi:hypothetical protein